MMPNQRRLMGWLLNRFHQYYLLHLRRRRRHHQTVMIRHRPHRHFPAPLVMMQLLLHCYYLCRQQTHPLCQHYRRHRHRRHLLM